MAAVSDAQRDSPGVWRQALASALRIDRSQIELLLAFVWSGYLTFRANYAIFTICITGYIVLLLYLAGVPGLLAAEYRALNTILGGVLALAIYRAWPTRESKRTGEMPAAVADAFARDARVVFDAYVDPRRWNEDALQKARAAARLARSNAEASVARLLAEPARGRLEPRCAVSLVAAFRRFALAALALHAGLHIRPPPCPSWRRSAIKSRQRLARSRKRSERAAHHAPCRRCAKHSARSNTC